MTQTPSNEKSGLAWVRKSILAEDVPQVEKMFLDILDHDAPKTLEFRLNQLAGHSHPAVLEDSETVTTTILGTVHMTFNPDGSVQHFVVWLTDITAQKLAKNDLRKRMDQAIHLKLQQEKFIDVRRCAISPKSVSNFVIQQMTSHELRNPLSAMVHCADEIIGALNKFIDTPTDGLVEDAIEAPDTIMYCAMHQKRIVDDILTLSRLDSDLIVISPQPAVLSKVIRQALKMFEPELKRADISLVLQEDDSLRGGDLWTLFDPGLVLQIFVNF
jgi:signal transduction histidine kinase